MALEIERKFLIQADLLPSGLDGILISQGYMHISDQKSIRVRIAGQNAFITIKGPDRQGIRSEFEYRIPPEDAKFMLESYCQSVLSKIRYTILSQSHHWEVDQFLDNSLGLWLAEIELQSPEEPFERPPWIGKEVTGEKRFYNTYLSIHPYNSWPDRL